MKKPPATLLSNQKPKTNRNLLVRFFLRLVLAAGYACQLQVLIGSSLMCLPLL